MTPDPFAIWSELTPGNLGRLAMTADPADVALALGTWADAPEARTIIAGWLRTVAAGLAAGQAWEYAAHLDGTVTLEPAHPPTA